MREGASSRLCGCIDEANHSVFSKLHVAFTAQDKSLSKGVLTYSKFMAPWIRFKMRAARKVLFLDTSALPNRREIRLRKAAMDVGVLCSEGGVVNVCTG